MCFIRNKAPQTECTDYPFLPQFFDMCFDIMGRVYGIGINANMVTSSVWSEELLLMANISIGKSH